MRANPFGGADDVTAAEETRFRDLVETLPHIVWSVGPDGRREYVNRRWTEITGLPTQEALDGRWLDPFHPDDRFSLAQAWQTTCHTGMHREVECRLRTADGAYRWFLHRIEPVKDEAEHVLRWIETCTDIDACKRGTLHGDGEAAQTIVSHAALAIDRKQTGEALRQIAARARCILWHATVEHQGGASFHWDLKLLDEEAAQRFFPVEIPPGLSYVPAWYESRLPEDKARMAEHASAELRAGRNYTQEFRCRRRDGEIRWLAEDVEVETIGPGRWRAVGVCMDITDRKRAEDALRESQARLRTLFECNIIGIGYWDGGGHLSEANDALLSILGYTREDLRGEKVRWRNLTPPEYRPLEERATAESREQGVCVPYEKEYIRKDGTRIPVLVGGAWLDAGGERGVFFALDLTERKRLELMLWQRAEALAEADRRKDEFLALLAHELRNPLAPIQNAVQLLKLASSSGPQERRAREIIDRQVRHQARLLDDLLDVSRITRGKIRLRRETVDLATLVREVGNDCCGSIEEAGLTLELRLPDGCLWVRGDPTRLSQIVGNLLGNAAKFTEPGGRVSVQLGEVSHREHRDHGEAKDGSLRSSVLSVSSVARSSFAILTVSDTGVGIEPQMLPRIFDPFAQADRSLDRSRGGLGLGLALVKGLVELHGGRVQAESSGLGQGTTFTVQLPLAQAPAPAAVDPATVRTPSQPLRVLIIEDHQDAAESLQVLLELSGYSVAIAGSGPLGLEAARQFQPDVVLCDLGLPEMDGYQVAATLRQNPGFSRTYLVAVSGYGQEEDRRRAREAGFDAHLLKPVDFDQLQHLLKSR